MFSLKLGLLSLLGQHSEAGREALLGGKWGHGSLWQHNCPVRPPEATKGCVFLGLTVQHMRGLQGKLQVTCHGE